MRKREVPAYSHIIIINTEATETNSLTRALRAQLAIVGNELVDQRQAIAYVGTGICRLISGE